MMFLQQDFGNFLVFAIACVICLLARSVFAVSSSQCQSISWSVKGVGGMGKNWIYPYIYGVDVGGGGSVDKMDKICFCLCCALQPVSKSAGVPRGLVGWVGAAMGMGKNWIYPYIGVNVRGI